MTVLSTVQTLPKTIPVTGNLPSQNRGQPARPLNDENRDPSTEKKETSPLDRLQELARTWNLSFFIQQPLPDERKAVEVQRLPKAKERQVLTELKVQKGDSILNTSTQANVLMVPPSAALSTTTVAAAPASAKLLIVKEWNQIRYLMIRLMQKINENDKHEIIEKKVPDDWINDHHVSAARVDLDPNPKATGREILMRLVRENNLQAKQNTIQGELACKQTPEAREKRVLAHLAEGRNLENLFRAVHALIENCKGKFYGFVPVPKGSRTHVFFNEERVKIYYPTAMTGIEGGIKKIGWAIQLRFNRNRGPQVQQVVQFFSRSNGRLLSNKLKEQLTFNNESNFDIRVLNISDKVPAAELELTSWEDASGFSERFTCDLEAWLAKQKNQSVKPSLLPIFMRMAECVQLLHDKKRIHIDLKLKHFLFRSPANVCLTDISKKQIPSTIFMSPEMYLHLFRINQDEISTYIPNKQADIWSLGICFYKLIVNRNPSWGKLLDLTFFLFSSLSELNSSSSIIKDGEKKLAYDEISSEEFKSKIDELNKILTKLDVSVFAALQVTSQTMDPEVKKLNENVLDLMDIKIDLSRIKNKNPLQFSIKFILANIANRLNAIFTAIYSSNKPNNPFEELIMAMLDFDPTKRPAIDVVIAKLRTMKEVKMV